MFIGYQNNLPAFIGETQEELENIPQVTFDRIEEVNFAKMYDGVIYLSNEDLINAKQDFVRSVRNNYLVEYVDGAVSNPLRWAEMSQDLKDMYINYRQYLLDYTETENWWKQNPLTLDEWRDQ